jgi:hypothetical protein
MTEEFRQGLEEEYEWLPLLAADPDNEGASLIEEWRLRNGVVKFGVSIPH